MHETLSGILPDISQTRSAARARPRGRRDFSQLLRWYIPADLLALHLGFFCALLLAGAINSIFFDRDILLTLLPSGHMRIIQVLMIMAGVVLWFEHTDHYRVRMPFWLEAQKVVCALGFAMMADGFLQFASKHEFSRVWLVSGWMIAAVAMLGMRALLRAYMRRKGRFQIPTLLVGAGETAWYARAALESEPGLGYEIKAQITNLSEAFMHEGRSWERLCAAYGVDYIVVALNGKELADSEIPLSQLMRE